MDSENPLEGGGDATGVRRGAGSGAATGSMG